MSHLSRKSLQRAQEILAQHTANLESCGALLCSVILVGSLTNGSYTGDEGSDIDLIHVLRNDAPPQARQKVLDLIAKTEADTGRDIPIARCVYRRGDLFPPYPKDFPLCRENKDYMELPIEILRIRDSGVTIWGEDLLPAIPPPTKADVIAAIDLLKSWTRQLSAEGTLPEQERLPIRLIVQSVLVHGLRDYFFATGKSCSNKAAVAGLMGRDVPDYAFLELMVLCTRWRYSPGEFSREDEARVLSLWQEWLSLRRGRETGDVPRKSNRL